MAPPKALDATFAVYALSTDGHNYRYVGYTGRYGIRRRMAMHRWEARHGTDRPVYDWMREEGPDNVIITVLEKLPIGCSAEDLGACETHWIERLREQGAELFNITAGGSGCRGVPLSPNQREALIAGSIAYHTGRPQTPEHIAAKVAATIGKKRGPYNWADVSKQAQSGARAAHNRWHAARGLVKENCMYCKEKV